MGIKATPIVKKNPKSTSWSGYKILINIYRGNFKGKDIEKFFSENFHTEYPFNFDKSVKIFPPKNLIPLPLIFLNPRPPSPSYNFWQGSCVVFVNPTSSDKTSQ